MNRRLVFVALVSFLVGGALSVPYAQQRGRGFQFTIDVPRGQAHVVCERGCDWPDYPSEGKVVCEQEHCKFTFTDQGQVRIDLTL